MSSRFKRGLFFLAREMNMAFNEEIKSPAEKEDFMLNYYEKRVAEVLLKILEEGKDSTGEHIQFGLKHYYIRQINDGADITMGWGDDENKLEDGTVLVGHWKKNWLKTLEVFCAVISCDID